MLYAAHGFKFQTDQEACKYFDIDYVDFLKWKDTNTGGWKEVEDYPKDAALELVIEPELVDPYKYSDVCVEEEEVKDSAPKWFTRLVEETWTLSLIVVGLTVAMILVNFGPTLPYSIFDDGVATLNSGLAQINATQFDHYDNKRVTGTQVLSAIELFADVEVGDNITVYDRSGKWTSGMPYNLLDVTESNVFVATLVKDKTGTVVGLQFEIEKR